MHAFLSAVFEAGKVTSIGRQIRMDSIGPSPGSVTKAIEEVAVSYRKAFCDGPLKLLTQQGGSATCDGVTLSICGRHFYDLTVHYLRFGVGKNSCSMTAKTILIVESQYGHTADGIRIILDNGLLKSYNIRLSDFLTNVTFVTDHAAVMAKMAGGSVSQKIRRWDETWVGCIAHSLNTAMKATIQAVGRAEGSVALIGKEMGIIKEIVRYFKKSGLNNDLPEGFKLIQEVETRFSTTFLVAERFLKSYHLLEPIIEKSQSESIKKLWHSLQTTTFYQRFVSTTAQSVVDCFDVIVEVQKAMEASNYPTLHRVLPGLIEIEKCVTGISMGNPISDSDSGVHRITSEITQNLAQLCLQSLKEKVLVHDMWLAANFLNIPLRYFQYVECETTRAEYVKRAKEFLRSMIFRKKNDEGICDGVGVEIVKAQPFKHADKKRKFSMSKYAALCQPPDAEKYDEVDGYERIDVHQVVSDIESFLDDPFAAPMFWFHRRQEFPSLFDCACHIFATPASSCASERVFSTLKHLANDSRSRISAQHIDDVIVVRNNYVPAE